MPNPANQTSQASQARSTKPAKPRVLIAPDSFKGCLTSGEVANAMARGFLKAGFDTDIMPIADGGEGFTEALTEACGGMIFSTKVEGPLGDMIEVHYAILDDGSIVLETAAASGLTLVSVNEPERALSASTYGTGQLIRAAVKHRKMLYGDDKNKRKRILIGLGGSATTDCGAGLLEALGARLTSGGKPVMRGGAALLSLDSISISGVFDSLDGYEITAACDVDNPLFGDNGAAAIFSPQKGASPEQVSLLDSALRHFHDIAVREGISKESDALVPGSGAAGGLGYALICLKATLCTGASIILEAANAKSRIAASDWVFTGEGKTDVQTLRGKAPMAVAKLSQSLNVPAILLSGAVIGSGDDSLYELLSAEGIEGIFSISDGPMDLSDALGRADELLCYASFNIGKLIMRSMKNE